MGKKTVKASGISSSTSNTTQRKPLIEISEEEQMRLIEQSGILTKVKAAEKNASLSKEEGVEERIPLSDEIFNAVLYIIPFSFLLLMMEMCVLVWLQTCNALTDGPVWSTSNTANAHRCRTCLTGWLPGFPVSYVFSPCCFPELSLRPVISLLVFYSTSQGSSLSGYALIQ